MVTDLRELAREHLRKYGLADEAHIDMNSQYDLYDSDVMTSFAEQVVRECGQTVCALCAEHEPFAVHPKHPDGVYHKTEGLYVQCGASVMLREFGLAEAPA